MRCRRSGMYLHQVRHPCLIRHDALNRHDCLVVLVEAVDQLAPRVEPSSSSFRSSALLPTASARIAAVSNREVHDCELVPQVTKFRVRQELSESVR